MAAWPACWTPWGASEVRLSGPAVLLLAGEPSGDQYGAALAYALRARRADLRLVGTGGPRMADAGVDLIAGLDELAVMGIAEVLPRLAFFRRLQRRIERLLDDPATALVVPIDFPGLNLRVARAAKRRNRKVLYYVPPKAWAWREGRARALAERTDVVAAILPFEKDFFARHGVRVEHVGHPLLDVPADGRDEPRFRERWRLPRDGALLALMPGSRAQELDRHLELFVAAAERVQGTRPDVLPVVARSPTLPVRRFANQPFALVDDARGLLRHARAALVKSGTGTLEAAIEGTPHVVAYRTSGPTWWVAKAALRVDHVSLPNLVAGAVVVPEFLQGAATGQALADALLPLLDPESGARREQVERLAGVRRALGAPGAADRVADLALGLMEWTG